MADELDDAEGQARDHQGLESHPHGRLLGRVIRHLRVLTTAVRDMKQRLDRIDPPQR
jgi:hypothetical protein